MEDGTITLSDKAKELRRAYNRKYAETHREQLKENRRAWREQNRERINAYHRQWAQEHPDKIKQYRASVWEKKARSLMEGEPE